MKTVTTQDLRATLYDSLEQVKRGHMDHNQAKAVALLADKIIRTAEIELEYSKVVSLLDQQGQGISPGPLVLTAVKDDAPAARN